MIKLYLTDKAAERILTAYAQEQQARMEAGLRSESMSAWATALILTALAATADGRQP